MITVDPAEQKLIDQFLQLVKQKEATARELKYVGMKLTDVMKQLSLGEMFQDPTDKVVYQVIIPSGVFVEYKTIDYIRTRKEGEKQGSLSITAAKEAGFSPSIPGGEKQ